MRGCASASPKSTKASHCCAPCWPICRRAGLSVPLPQASGEGIGWAEGFRGDIWHWLRLDGGQIAAAFMRDPSWLQWPLLEAAMQRQHRRRLPAVQQIVQLLLFRGGFVMVWRRVFTTLRARPGDAAGRPARTRRRRRALAERLDGGGAAPARAQPGDPAGGCRQLQRLRAGNPHAEHRSSTTWSGSACASSPAPAMPTCCW